MQSVRVSARRGPKITPHRQHCRGSVAAVVTMTPSTQPPGGLFLDLQEHPTCSWQAGTVPSASPSTNQLISTTWGVGAQQASLETWQPGNSQFLRWWMVFCQKYNPFCNCTGLSVTPHRSIVQALRDACRTRGEHVIL